MKKFWFVTILLGGAISLIGQRSGTLKVNDQVFPYMIDECGDTLIMAQLDDVSVSSLRKFKSEEEEKRYRKYRRYAAKVYPYAVEAIKIFREVEAVTADMEKRKHKKKYTRKLAKDLKKEFSDPLKKLTKTQGKILVKMIEKELDTPLYYLIKDLRGGLTATKWSTLGKFYGHQLKEGYTPGEDPIMDAVLNDLDISYELSKN